MLSSKDRTSKGSLSPLVNTKRENIAVIYARYSSHNQKETSISIQLEACEQFAKSQGLTILKVYRDEAKSATTDERDQFKLMLSDSVNGLFGNIIIYNLSRFSRNIIDSIRYREQLESNNVKILSVQEGFDDSTPEGNLFNMIQMSLNQFYSANLSRSVLNGSIATAKDIEFCGGTPPLGYDITNQRYQVNEYEAETVKLIFSMFLKGHSFNFISNKLNEEGRQTKMGNYWNGDFRHILTNRKYTGCMTYNLFKRRKLFSKQMIKEAKSEQERIIVPNSIPRIISDEDFQQAQEQLKMMKVLNYRNIEANNLLDGFVKCGKCGKLMLSKKVVGGKNMTQRYIYRCKGYSSKNCRNKSINVLYLDNFIITYLDKFFSQTAKDVRKLISDKLEIEKNDLCKKLENLSQYDAEEQVRIDELTKRLSKLPAIDQHKVSNLIAEKIILKLAREKNIKELESRLKSLSVYRKVKFELTKRNFRDAFTSNDIQKMREFLYSIMPSITLSDNDLIITLNLGIFLESFKDKLLVDVKINRLELLKMKKNKSRLIALGEANDLRKK